MSAFTPERAGSLPGPEWLRRRRADAATRFASAALPTAEPESWRYSPIADLHLDRFEPTGGAAAVLPTVAVPSIAGAAAVVVVANGRIASIEVADGDAVAVEAAGDAPLELLAPPEPDALTALHDAFVPEIVVVRLRAGKAARGPVLVVNATEGETAAAFPHVVVDAGPQSEGTVVEWSVSGDAPLYVAPVTELHVGDAANLRYVSVQGLGASTWQTGHLLATVGRDATVRAWLLAVGGSYARTYVAATLAGQGSNAQIAGVYFGDEQQVHDVRSLQDHVGARSVSDFQLKGAVVDKSRGIYTGLIRVREDAKATVSFLGNRNLVLSDGAHVDSVPNLEIVNENDIRSCGHAAATGPVDEEQLFYLESRGVPTLVAQRLIVAGFFGEVLAGVPVAEARDAVRATVALKLAKVGVE